MFLASDSNEKPISDCPQSYKEALDGLEELGASSKWEAEIINLCSDDSTTDKINEAELVRNFKKHYKQIIRFDEWIKVKIKFNLFSINPDNKVDSLDRKQ